MTKRHTLETFAAKARQAHGDKYTYQELAYGQGAPKARITCPEHGDFWQNLSDHAKGRGCPSCGNVAKGMSKRLSLSEWVERSRKVHGDKYTYTDLTYTGYRGFLHIVCPEHGPFKQNAIHHTAEGKGCSKCGRERTRVSHIIQDEEYLQRARAAHNNKYTYGNLNLPNRRVEVICPEHDMFHQERTAHLAGQGCAQCNFDKLKVSNRMTYEEFLEKARRVHGDWYTYPEDTFSKEPRGVRPTVGAICPSHGFFQHLINGHVRGHGCAHCGGRISRLSTEVADYLRTFTDVEVEVPLHGRKTVDIFLPKFNIAIEFNGAIWHSSKYSPDSRRHLEKTRLAKERGWRLVHLWSGEWKFQTDTVKRYLAGMCGQFRQRVFARKCEVVDVDRDTARTFLEAHHIQGYNQMSQYTGLMHGETLVAVMGFSFQTSNRLAQKKDDCVELTRYACDGQVVGGFSKLLKAFLAKQPLVKKVVSFSDIRFFDGHTYSKNGFVQAEVLNPDYKYVAEGWDDTLKHKAGFSKTRLAQMFGEEACLGKTERQITEENNLWRVYDCGKVRWELNVA